MVKRLFISELKVSEKYETELDGITESPVLIKEAKEKSLDIERSENEIETQILVTTGLVITLLLVYYWLCYIPNNHFNK